MFGRGESCMHEDPVKEIIELFDARRQQIRDSMIMDIASICDKRTTVERRAEASDQEARKERARAQQERARANAAEERAQEAELHSKALQEELDRRDRAEEHMQAVERSG
ncbi:hypothetical protein B0H14DRAFT_2594272 [Mycena olivaceomarginata]|nr:hypothetical protein B0H14DRAFT_2594272 [Mycena olivaceomarginata]